MTTVFDRVLKEIEERRDVLAQTVVSGAAKDFDEYRGMCGEIRGLSFAYNNIIDLQKKLEQED
jgi:hypothetical protein